jgi:putative peptidoglycan lipid II flippase
MSDPSQTPTGGVQAPAIQPPVASAGRRLARNTAIVGAAFVLSRVLGLVREAVLAGQFGTSPEYDAYVAAFGIPDTLFLLIIGGAVGAAFIPVFTKLEREGEEAKAWRLASTLINASVVVLSLLGIIMLWAAPLLVDWVIAPGPNVDKALVADLTRILLLSPLFMGLGGWAQGILNARNLFALPAFAPVLYNLAIIGGALFLVPVWGIYGVAWGVVAGALLHFALQVPGLLETRMRYSLRLNLRDEGAREVGKLLVPRLVGQAAFQANIVAVRAIGSFLPVGRISALNYAYILMMLPHGVFAMSLATTTFPAMAAQYAEGDLEGVRATLSRAVRVLLFLTLPAAVGLLLLRSEIVSLIFEFGQFRLTSRDLVASALGYFALGLVAYAVVELLTRGFYALHDTATPVAISVATVLLNIGLSMALVWMLGWGHEGLALSLALTTTVEMVLMWVWLARRLPGWRLGMHGFLPSVLRSGAASALMGVALFFILPMLHALLPRAEGDKIGSALIAMGGIGVGGALYLFFARMLGSEEVQAATSIFLRRLPLRRGR